MTTPEQRRRSIADLVTQHDGLSVEELASELAVSPSTIRRDLSDLAERGIVERTHGGAVPVTNVGVEQPFNQRVIHNLDRKQPIGERAVKEIQEGQVVYFDAGTTTMQAAKKVPDDLSNVFVTNSPLLLSRLANEEETVKLTGGQYRYETKALIGPAAENYIRHSNFDLAFLGVNGISEDGELSTPNESEAELKRLVMARTSRVVVVTVIEKFGEQTFRQFGSIDDIDLLITDARVPEPFRDLFDETELAEDVFE
ncbi:HTH-type transcriptional regulator GlpR [Halobellus ruber]|uniref:DeoR/GlpR transcriptional regulator n=1 Tax=Halobellus ruber TaxID=2761102 RepID=A0A7J9SG53_9EURY|nr:HTH-type transcriptional regulator GlpR [Halobellus ruber]MBB6645698.1 DeoR/GlpR transcriptional regulator [Halobellus ruber]